jgi:hypothetical protein
MNGTVVKFAVTLDVAPMLEERVVDWLLSRDGAEGFTTYATYGHGSRHDELSVAEQVSGRQRRVAFRTEIDVGTLDAFVESLRSRFAGTDVHYFVTPVVASGQLR